MLTILMLVAATTGILIISIITLYNGLVNKKNQIENAFGGMDAQLKKRYDLIPNIISLVKEYVQHEVRTQTSITEKRAQSLNNNKQPLTQNKTDTPIHTTISEIEALRNEFLKGKSAIERKVEMDNILSHKLQGLFIAVEDYPELKASQNFIHAQDTLNEAETQISYARLIYNDVVTIYNNGIEMFPSNMIAKLMNFDKKSIFVIPEAQRKTINTSEILNV